MSKWLEYIYRYCADSKKVLWTAITLSIIFMSIYVAFCLNLYDDVARCYGPMVQDIGNARWHQAFTGYDMIAPLVQTLAGVLCYCGVKAYTALIIISALFYIITIFPLYGLLRRFISDNYAAWGCFAYIVAPKIIRFSGTGLLNSARNFFIIWALYALLKFFDHYKKGQLIWLGVALGGLALARGEGVGFIPLFGLFFIIIFYLKQRHKSSHLLLLKLIGYIMLLATVFLSIISPRLIQMYRDTGYPVIDKRQAHYLYFLFGQPDEKLKKESLNRPTVTEVISGQPAPLPRVKQPVRAKAHRTAYWLEFLGDISRGSYELYLILAIVGIVVIVKTHQWRAEYYLLLAVAFFNALIFYNVVIAYRYFTINLLLFMPFTVLGVVFLVEQIKKYLPNRLQPRLILLLALLAITSGQVINGMAMVKRDHRCWFFKPVGEWLRSQAPKQRLVIISDQPQFAFWADAIRPNINLDKAENIARLQKLQFDYLVITNRHHEALLKTLDKLGYHKVKHPYQAVATIYRGI